MRISLTLATLIALGSPAGAGEDVGVLVTAEGSMQPQVGHVKFKSTPPGARITIDGQVIGVTPLDWDLPPGKHTIQMDKAGFEPQSRELIVVSNKTELFGMKLVPPGDGDDDRGDKPSRLLPMGLLAAGGALLIAGGAMIYFDEDPSPDLGPTIHNTGPTGVGLAIGGAVVAGAGAYLMWFRSPETSSTPVAAITGDAAYIGWLGRF
jgi:hypothetical protein